MSTIIEYFLNLKTFYGYDKSQVELLAGSYTISHESNNLYSIAINNFRVGKYFTRDDIHDFLTYDFDIIIETFDGYRSLFMPAAEKSAICIQRATRRYLKKLKWRRIGLAIMAILSPILYHPKSPYIQRMIANYD
jgi:hypothetical protein